MTTQSDSTQYIDNIDKYESPNRILLSLMSCSLAIVPCAIVRGIIIALGAIANMAEWYDVSRWAASMDALLLILFPWLMNILISIYWATRNNLSSSVNVTLSLSLLIVTQSFISHGTIFFNDVSIPLAVITGVFSNLLMENINNYKKRIENNETRVWVLYTSFLKLLVIYIMTISFPLLLESHAKLLTYYIYPDNFLSGLFYLLLRTGTWFFGINGHLVFLELSKQFLQASLYNLHEWREGRSQLNILSTMFYETWCSVGGSGGTLSLLICMSLGAFKKNRALIAVSFPMTLLNINEPLIFGVPVVLNPVMFIPFILTPVMSYVVAYYATMMGYIYPVHSIITWTTPPLLNGWLSTGSWSGLLLQIFIIILGCMIYYPFWRNLQTRNQFYIINKDNFNLSLTAPTNLLLDPSHNHIVEAYKHADAWRKINTLLSHGQFILWFQPQVCLSTKRIIALEVLLRYRSENGIILLPSFLDYFSKMNMLPQVEFWIIEQIINHIHEDFSSCNEISFCVNISPATLMHKDIFNILDRLLERPLPPGRSLEFEIIESEQLTNLSEVKSVIEGLHQRGIRITLDSFGSGYSSLLYLVDLSLDKIKIDHSFIRGMSHSGGLDFFTNVVHLCLATSSQVLVEGIKTAEEAFHVKACGVSLAQGCFFHNPMPIGQVCKLIDKQVWMDG